MIWQEELSPEAAAARNLGDEDWEDLVQYEAEGCSRTPIHHKDNFGRYEPEPVTIKDWSVPRTRVQSRTRVFSAPSNLYEPLQTNSSRMKEAVQIGLLTDDFGNYLVRTSQLTEDWR